jgi:hypothetical protein
MPDTAVMPVGRRSTLPPPGTYRLAGCVLERTSLPLLHRRIQPNGGELAVGDESTLTLTDLITATVAVEGRRRLRISGRLDLHGRRHSLSLTARVVHVDDLAIVFAASGIAVTAGRRRLRIEAAMEFTQ